MLTLPPIDHCDQEAAGHVGGARPDVIERTCDPLCLQTGQFHGQRFACWRGVKKALPAVVGAFLLQDIAFVDQLLEDTGQRLLGDIEDLQEICHLHTRMPCHEMQNAVVGTAEAECGQCLVGIPDEIAVGEKQELDQIPDGFAAATGRRRFCGMRMVANLRHWHDGMAPKGGYVSHIDIFLEDCYRKCSANEISCWNGPAAKFDRF